MTKQDLFNKYSIDDSHNKWESIDNWYSVEIYREMHNGELPTGKEASLKYILDFADKIKEDHNYLRSLDKNGMNWGSFYLTSKRMIYTLHERILKELNL